MRRTFLALRVDSVANIGAYMAGVRAACRPTSTCICKARSTPSRHRAARAGGAEQHGAGRRHARAGLRRDRQHPGTADRRGGAARRFRSCRSAPAQHGAAEAMPFTNVFGFAVDSGAFRRNLRPRARARRCRRLRRAPPRKRRARQTARAGLRLSHQGHRRLAARERRYPLRGGRQGFADHRHADDRPGPRDDLSADPRRPAWHRQCEDPCCARATPT